MKRAGAKSKEMELLEKSFTTRSIVRKLRMRFFDLRVVLRSDSEKYIDLFARMYRRFMVDDSSPFSETPVEFEIWTSAENPWQAPVMVLDGETRFLKDPHLLEGYVYESVLRSILERVRSHFLIHAGVVSWHDQGIILAADAMHGKTTLTLELVRRGFKFLSDEMAAMGRSDRLVWPFPRSLRVRPGTLELAGLSEGAAQASMWLDKLILDIETIKPGSMGEAVPITNIVVLRDPVEQVNEVCAKPTRELLVMVDRTDAALVAAVGQIQDVTRLCACTAYGYPALELHTANRMRVLSQIEALCRERQILILGVMKRKEHHPSFDAPARLEPMSTDQATMELLKRFQGGHKSSLLRDEFSGSPSRLFMELAGIIQQSACFRLSVGPLGQMADLVSGLVKA